MSEAAIVVENLSKRFEIARNPERYTALRDRLTQALTSPLRMFSGRDKQSATREFWALRDLSFEVAAGEAIGIIGRNGAGKSTLLKILSRITEPSHGRAILHGRISSLLEVGSGFHPELSGRDNIYMNGAILGMRKFEIDRKFDQIVDFAETGKFIDTAIKHYSSGMYMRLAFAVAAHLESEILFVDEVLAVGDAQFQKRCLERMQGIAREGRTVIFVSHNLTAISTLCRKTLYLDAGQIVAYGPTQQVVSAYLVPEGGAFFDRRQFPQEEAFHLLDARVMQGDAETGPFQTSLPIRLELEYEIKSELSGLRIGFDALTEDGIVLWRSWDDDMAGTTSVGRPAGKYKAVCTIPGNLFFPRTYILSLSIAIHRTRWISLGQLQQGVSFFNAGGVGWAYADEANRAGVLMVGLEWSTETVSENRETPAILR